MCDPGTNYLTILSLYFPLKKNDAFSYIIPIKSLKDRARHMKAPQEGQILNSLSSHLHLCKPRAAAHSALPAVRNFTGDIWTW